MNFIMRQCAKLSIQVTTLKVRVTLKDPMLKHIFFMSALIDNSKIFKLLGTNDLRPDIICRAQHPGCDPWQYNHHQETLCLQYAWHNNKVVVGSR
jgi:hypothetical protein